MLTPDQFAAISEMLQHVENAAFKCGEYAERAGGSYYRDAHQKLISDRGELLSYLNKLTEKPSGRLVRTVRFKHPVTILPGDNIRGNSDGTFDHIRHYPPGTYLTAPFQMREGEVIAGTPDGGIARIWPIEVVDEESTK